MRSWWLKWRKPLLPNVIEENDQESFFGKLFKGCPEKFKFFSTQKIIIRNLISFSKIEKNSRSNSDFGNSKSRKRKPDSLQNKENDVDKEINNCKSLAKDWFQKNMPSIDIQDINVLVSKTTNEELQVNIECPVCRAKYKAHKF